MKPVRILTARNAAWKTLNQCHILRHDTADVLNELLTRSNRPAQTTDIVYGVIRHRGTIDRILKNCATLEPERVKAAQWNLLRMGVYELVFAPKTADYAILNEAADLAGQAGSKKTAGFINAVLRNVQRSIQDRQGPIRASNLRRVVPHTEDRGCVFGIDLMPDPQKQAKHYLMAAFSLPEALISEWLNFYGFTQTKAICFASNRRPSTILQTNTLRTTADDLVQQLQKQDIECQRIHDQIRIRPGGKINRLAAYLDGLFFMQDPAASSAVAALAPQPGWALVDLCAAPGGKSMAAAIHMRDQGLIIASDTDTKRLQKVRENAKRTRLLSIEFTPPSRIEQTIRKLKRLDAIILDVPCSNTGVLARRVEVRWRWNPKEAEALGKIQQELLSKAASFARPETKILYSTCSIQPKENQQLIQAFLLQHKQFVLQEEQLVLPAIKTAAAFDHDGGYAAVIKGK
jgi:16S rRNA (cytosine967-C5)-methyltransferase